MSRKLSNSVQIMGEGSPSAMKAKIGIRLQESRSENLDDQSRPETFDFEGLEFKGWLSPFGDGFGLRIVDGDLPAEVGAEHLAMKLEQVGVNVEGVFDMENNFDRNKFSRWATRKLTSTSQASSPQPTTVGQRLKDIEAKMPNDRFIKSLQDNLKRYGRLTPKQLAAVAKIENKLANPQPVDQALISRVNAILAKMPSGNTFLESVRDQVANGRTLSKKQLDAIAKFEQPKKSRTRRPRQDGGQYTDLSQFHTWGHYHQLNALAGGHVARALYGIPEMGSDEERIFTLLADVASASHAQMNIMNRIKATRRILPHLGKHPLLKNLPEEIAEDILRKVIVDGHSWRDDVSML